MPTKRDCESNMCRVAQQWLFRHLCRGCGSPPGKLMEWHDPLADHSGVEDVVSSLELAGLLEKRSIEDVIVISCDATSSIYI